MSLKQASNFSAPAAGFELYSLPIAVRDMEKAVPFSG